MKHAQEIIECNAETMPRRHSVPLARLISFAATYCTVVLILLSWALAIGRYGGPDEPAHVLRAAAVAQGQFRGDRIDGWPPGFRAVSVPASLASGDPICYRRDRTVAASCAVETITTGQLEVATAAANYPPLYYALVGGPTILISDGQHSLFYRLAAIVLQAMVLTFAFLRARPLGRPATMLVAVIGPAGWYLAGVVNPNAIELALCLAAWVGVARVRANPLPSCGELVSISVPLGLAIAIRPTALAVTVAIAAMLIASGVRATRHVLLTSVTPIGLAIASVLVWNSAIGLRFEDDRTALPDGRWRATWSMLVRLPGVLWDAVGSLGWDEFAAPPVAVAALLAIFALVLLAAWRRSQTDRRVVAIWTAGLLATPLLFTWATGPGIGTIWQGRYSLPMLAGLVALSPADDGRRQRWWLAVLVIAAGAEVATFWTALGRHVAGLDGGLPPSISPGWNPALAPPILLVGHTIVVVAAAGSLWRGCQQAAHLRGQASGLVTMRANEPSQPAR